MLIFLLAFVLNGCSWTLVPPQDSVWDHPELSRQGCPNLAGEYSGYEVWIEFKEFWRLLRVVSIKSPPEFSEPYYDKNLDLDYKKISPKSKTLISNENGWPVIYSTDGEGNKFSSKVLVDFKDRMVGCQDGYLVMRYTLGFDYMLISVNDLKAIEIKFRKLPDGNIEVIENEKIWRRHGRIYLPPTTVKKRRIHDAAP
jgi:hypothetical protein